MDCRLLVPASLLIDSLPGDPETRHKPALSDRSLSAARLCCPAEPLSSLRSPCFLFTAVSSRKVLASVACTRHSHSRYTPTTYLSSLPHNHGCRSSSHCWPTPGQSRPAAEQTGYVANPPYIIDTHLTSIPAEQALKAQESTPGFSLALLQIVSTDSFPQATRLAAALFFKNFVRRNWVVRDGQTQNGGVDRC
jgi:hypothetical protein